MKKELKTLFVILCTLALVTGVQAQDDDPVGLTPTKEDAKGEDGLR